MKLTIFGATGGTGRQIVAQALEQGHEISAFSRHPEQLDPNENLHSLQGDVLDPAAVARAIDGRDAVLCALGAPPFDKSGLRARGTQVIIQAMRETGVGRLVCQSSLGVGESHEVLSWRYRYLIVPLMLRAVFADHALQEAYIRESGLDWVIARPAALTNGALTGEYKHGFAATDKAIALKVSRADVAHFMLRQLEDDTYLRQTPGISY